MKNLAGLVVIFALPSLLHISVVRASEAEISCYCNTEECAVSNGYRCRSQLGRCFSKMRYDPQPEDEDNSLHGCAEALPVDERKSCERGDIILRRSNADARNELPILMCCTANMCNYIDKVDPPNVAIDVLTPNESQHETSQGNSKWSPSQRVINSGAGVGTSEYYANTDTWFRIAVVTVPVIGAIILVILVLLALRMLKNDSRRQSKRDASMTKTQLYVADHFYSRTPATSSSAILVTSPNYDVTGTLLPGAKPGVIYNGEKPAGIIYSSDVEDNLFVPYSEMQHSPTSYDVMRDHTPHQPKYCMGYTNSVSNRASIVYEPCTCSHRCCEIAKYSSQRPPVCCETNTLYTPCNFSNCRLNGASLETAGVDCQQDNCKLQHSDTEAQTVSENLVSPKLSSEKDAMLQTPRASSVSNTDHSADSINETKGAIQQSRDAIKDETIVTSCDKSRNMQHASCDKSRDTQYASRGDLNIQSESCQYEVESVNENASCHEHLLS